MFGPSSMRHSFLNQLESAKKADKKRKSDAASSSKKKGSESSSASKKRKKEKPVKPLPSPQDHHVNDEDNDVVMTGESSSNATTAASTLLPLPTVAVSASSQLEQLPIPSSHSPTLSSQHRKASTTNLNFLVKSPLDEILESNANLIKEEREDYERVKKYFDNFCKQKNAITNMCSEHIERIQEILKKIDERVVVSFFAKPGYGKSYMINRLVSGFQCDNYPLPSGTYLLGKGITSTVIDIMYDEFYSLTKEMCTVQEYNLREKNVKNEGKKLSYEKQLENIEIDSQSNIILSGNTDTERLSCILARARQVIEKYEKEKTTFDSLTVKKLVLKVPSPFLKESRVILRDMPGYDELTEGELYKQFIRESFLDTCIIVSGIENNRNILDDGIVRKAWEYGIHQPSQVIRPSIAILCNNPNIVESTYYDLLDNYELIEGMKKSFRKQLALHYDILLEGVVLSERDVVNSTPVEFDDKINFVKSLEDNFGVTFFPPQNAKTDSFIEKFRYIIEKNRKKVIEYNASMIRDMAVVILSNIKVPKENQAPAQFCKQFNKVRRQLCEMFAENLELTISYSPDADYLYGGDLSSLINSLISFYESPIALLFDKRDISARLQKFGASYRRRLKSEEKQVDWSNHFNTFMENFLETVESFTLFLTHTANSFKQSIISTCVSYSDMLDTNVVKELVKILDINDNSKVDDFLETIHSGLCNFHEHIRTYFEAIKESLKEISSGMDNNVKLLFEKYKRKSAKYAQVPTELNSKYPQPCKYVEILSMPKSESSDVKDIAEKHYCAPNDKLMDFDLKKSNREQIAIKKVDHEGEANELLVKFDRTSKQLLLSYNTKTVEEVSSPIRKLNSNGLKPLFILTRPRGKNYKLQIYESDRRYAKTNNLHHMFVIVTESKYVARYKKSIEENEGNPSDYFFLILDSDVALGYGIVHSSILAVANYLHIESIHIVHDDIRQFYEYSYEHKVYSPHDSAMLRALIYMEKVLEYELFNPQKADERRESLEHILFDEIPDNTKKEVVSIMKEQEEDEEDIKSVDDGKLGILQVLRILVENLPKKSRQKYTDIITSFSNQESKDTALVTLSKNPQEFLSTLRELSTTHKIKVAEILIELIEEEFNDKKHIGRVSLWNNQTKQELKNRVHNLSKPTHLVSYITSSVHTYFIPSMEGIYPIGLEDFWKEPNNEERKKTLTEIRNIGTKNKSAKKNEKKRAKAKVVKSALERGWTCCDIGEKTQMLLHGVGSFQVFNFGYARASVPSLVDYSSRKEGKDGKIEYNSDEESVEVEEDEE
ncbi:hypothetical protein NAEGRDRAFT_80834 [Naegleria gruberi]|uniref:Uncharacterized protein n=1 Tax=Naegleria gruberi TaxID=5762 RepID=D2VQ04_NAEGR|nr:uncharacterized protein NAEGRDRAFT_80834 [Naegleria gruberi]EFC41094.1 hypothetical protein NAEGRDRAFT_80834 [Naegleria gruberi]|eukprot:XP_002673838.1 hypothetical protein NAEGRDRAFT_80834 [Naegleria gruberi strain NEG-M]